MGARTPEGVVGAETSGSTSHELRGLTAVIVNWETPEYTIRAARALLDDGLRADQLVIVDNGSKDESYEEIRREFPGAVAIRLEENIGYARAANVGARARATGDLLFINNDAFVNRPGSVPAMTQALERDPSVGIVTARVLRPDLTVQPTVVALQTPAVALVRASGLSRLIPNRWQPSWGTHWDQSSSREIQAVSTVAVLVRRATWEQLEGFEESTYLYADDLDFCFRARRSGWKVWLTADAEFLHIGGGSTATRWSNPKRREMHGRAEARMIRRNLSPLAAWASLTFISAGLSARYLVHRVVGRPEAADSMRATLRGLWARS
jgi:N-acetylglucosaminyl-diphospho-decaprenol L-rhamnosyltransferase